MKELNHSAYRWFGRKRKKKKIRLLERRRRRLERKKRQSVPEGKNIYGLRRVPERKEGSTPFGQTHRLVFHKRTK